jgi:hypothetical protein
VRPEPRATRASKVTKEILVKLEPKGFKVYKEKRELQEQLVPLENKEFKVYKEKLELRETKAIKVTRVILEQLVQQEQLVSKAYKV